jgi:hypothetical protein
MGKEGSLGLQNQFDVATETQLKRSIKSLPRKRGQRDALLQRPSMPSFVAGTAADPVASRA